MKTNMTKYYLPKFLEGQIDQAVYKRWLDRKVRAHVKRDRQRGFKNVIAAEYKMAIHEAVVLSGGRDEYTGWQLDWYNISKFNNDAAKNGKREYMKKFTRLPTVDHIENGKNSAKFKICSWIVNDMKSHLTPGEFKKICKAVLEHSKGSSSSKIP